MRFSPVAAGVELTKDDIANRLLARRQKDPKTGCWVWTGHWTRNGQGQIYIPVKKLTYAHKAAAHVWLGTPLYGPHKVVHKKECGTPACFNPDHLLIFQTESEIAQAQKAGLVRGQKLGEARNHTKMTLAKALEIKKALLKSYADKKAGRDAELFVDIAERLDVSNNQVRGIHARRSWKYIWDEK
jgi:hypothetical protein